MSLASEAAPVGLSNRLLTDRWTGRIASSEGRKKGDGLAGRRNVAAPADGPGGLGSHVASGGPRRFTDALPSRDEADSSSKNL